MNDESHVSTSLVEPCPLSAGFGGHQIEVTAEMKTKLKKVRGGVVSGLHEGCRGELK